MDLQRQADLLVKAKAGDVRSFEEAIEPYLRMLLAYAWSSCGDYHTAQDVTQETAWIAFKNIEHLFPDADFGAWLKAIARRKGLEARRRLGRASLGLEEWMEKGYENPDPDATDGGRAALRECLQSLPDRMSKVVQGYYLERSAMEKIADSLETSQNAVKQLLYRARLVLRDCIRKRMRMGIVE